MRKEKLLWFAVLLLPLQSLASGYTVGNNWRWSKDNGSLGVRAEADWLRPVNTTPVISTPQALRLRMLTIATQSYNLGSSDRLILEYRTEPQPNSATVSSSNGINVNATSPTAGSWVQVQAQSPATTTNVFVMDPNYNDQASGALRDKSVGQTSAFNLLYNNNTISSGATGPIAFARHEDITISSEAARKGAVGLSKTAVLTSGSISGFNQIPAGGLETEYRLVVTKNAEAGKTYYFRVRNTGGTAVGTIDHWDYAAGYPSIAISNDYNGQINSQLPDLRPQFMTGDGVYVTGTPRSGSLRISNLGTVPSSGPISVDIVVPTGWTLNFTSLPSNWSYAGGVLSTTSEVLAAGGTQSFPFTLVNSNAGFTASNLQALISSTVVDGNGSNNATAILVYKQQ